MPCPDCKRKAAEVLAACSVYLEKIAERYGIDSLVGRELLQGSESIKTEVQPAASALEALLREEQKPLLDVLRDAPSPVNISSPHGQILELDNAMFHKAYFDWHKRRIAELEKARASEGKG